MEITNPETLEKVAAGSRIIWETFIPGEEEQKQEKNGIKDSGF